MNIAIIKKDMEGVIRMYEEDLRTLRAGRASAELVNTLPVNAYGSDQTLQAVASVAADGNQLIVQAWDKGLMKSIEDAIRNSQLGFSVINEGHQLRLTLPPMSTERRQELIKVVGQKAEAARIELRKIRRDAVEKMEKQEKSGEIREDELRRFVKDIDDEIGNFNDSVKTVTAAKEKELMTV